MITFGADVLATGFFLTVLPPGRWRIFLLAALSIMASPAFAAGQGAPSIAGNTCGDKLRERNSQPYHSHHLIVENDTVDTWFGLHHSDRWYTNGIKAIDTRGPEDPATAFHCWMPDLLGWFGPEDRAHAEKREYKYDFGWALGQLMFTPQSITMPQPQPTDRFWGGWLYLGAVVQRHSVTPGTSVFLESETVEVDYGLVGPISLAETFQKGVHSLVGAPAPQGWGNQLRDEAGIQVTYLKSVRELMPVKIASGLETDLTVHHGFNVGTVFDYANAGITWRIGNRLREAPIGTIESPTLGELGHPNGRWYFLLRIDGKLVAHNTFIDGSLVQNAPYDSLVRSKMGVVQGSAGAVWEFGGSEGKGWRLSFLLHRRSPEFNVPGSTSPTQTFGTIAIERGL
jgi:hypothetical protein